VSKLEHCKIAPNAANGRHTYPSPRDHFVTCRRVCDVSTGRRLHHSSCEQHLPAPFKWRTRCQCLGKLSGTIGGVEHRQAQAALSYHSQGRAGLLGHCHMHVAAAGRSFSPSPEQKTCCLLLPLRLVVSRYPLRLCKYEPDVNNCSWFRTVGAIGLRGLGAVSVWRDKGARGVKWRALSNCVCARKMAISIPWRSLANTIIAIKTVSTLMA
jgi:hypothetical protein